MLEYRLGNYPNIIEKIERSYIVRKGEKWYLREYLQGSLEDSACHMLLSIQEQKEIDSLKHIIVQLTEEQIGEVILRESKLEIEYTKGELRPMQTVGVGFMYMGKQVLLGDEVGLGKTVQIAGLMRMLGLEGSWNHCFLTESTSAKQIQRKLIQYTGEYVYLIETGGEKDVEKYIKKVKEGYRGIVVGTHALLSNSTFLMYASMYPYELIVIDESSVVKNTDSEVYKNTKEMLSKYRERRIVLLNATPWETEALEMYTQIDLLDPYFLMPRDEFIRRYVKREKIGFTYKVAGYKNKDEFKDIVKLRYIGRTREGEGAVYEGNSVDIELLPMSDVQKQIIKKTTLYQLVYDYPKGVNRNVEVDDETTPKIRRTVELVKEERDTKEVKCLIYCNFKACQEELRQRLEIEGLRVDIINGETKGRQGIIDRFVTGDLEVIITNVKKGVDLANCDLLIMYTIDTNPKKMVQVEGRMTREFNVKDKRIKMLVMEGKEMKSLEDMIMKRIEGAKGMAHVGSSLIETAVMALVEKRLKDARM